MYLLIELLLTCITFVSQIVKIKSATESITIAISIYRPHKIGDNSLCGYENKIKSISCICAFYKDIYCTDDIFDVV